MPAPDFDPRLLSEVQCICEQGRWRVVVTYAGQRYTFGTWLDYEGAHHACSASAVTKALSSPLKRDMRRLEEAPRPARQEAQVSPLVGTDTRHRHHREQFWDFVRNQAEPRYRAALTRLLGVWEEANQAYYGGVLVPPIILLAEPSNPRRLGDCSPISGWGAESQIRIRPSLLAGTHPNVREGNHDPEGLFRFVADVLLHEQIHQWQQEVTGQREESYHGHGPRFCAKCNEIGAALGLAQVIVKTRPQVPMTGHCSEWPYTARPFSYYLGAVTHLGGVDPGPQRQRRTIVPANGDIIKHD